MYIFGCESGKGINYDLNEGVTDKSSVFGNDICLIKDYDNEGFFNIKKLEIIK